MPLLAQHFNKCGVGIFMLSIIASCITLGQHQISPFKLKWLIRKGLFEMKEGTQSGWPAMAGVCAKLIKTAGHIAKITGSITCYQLLLNR